MTVNELVCCFWITSLLSLILFLVGFWELGEVKQHNFILKYSGFLTIKKKKLK